MPNRCRTLTNSFTIKLLIFQHNFFSVLTYMLKNQAELLKHDFNSSIYVQQKSCKTKKAQLFASKFRCYIFRQVKTLNYIVIWFGHGSAGGSAEPSRTSKFGQYRCRCRCPKNVPKRLQNVVNTFKVLRMHEDARGCMRMHKSA